MASSDPIGTAGRAWTEEDRNEWRSRQLRHRSYFVDVVTAIDALRHRFERICYGEAAYGDDRYPLYALLSRVIDKKLPTALITGGVHGYETSGVTGALAFLEQAAAAYDGRVNLIVAPCVSPWGYERINRWNYDAIDPNRSFHANGPIEARALIELVKTMASNYCVHVDLHETTDTDRTEFGPARSARDGDTFMDEPVPDGFYLVADSENVQLEFHQAIIASVEKLTYIALPDVEGNVIGSPMIAPGIIAFPASELALCVAITDAPFKTSTEVYPDSAYITSEVCVAAQVIAIRAAIDFALAHPESRAQLSEQEPTATARS